MGGKSGLRSSLFPFTRHRFRRILSSILHDTIAIVFQARFGSMLHHSEEGRVRPKGQGSEYCSFHFLFHSAYITPIKTLYSP